MNARVEDVVKNFRDTNKQGLNYRRGVVQGNEKESEISEIILCLWARKDSIMEQMKDYEQKLQEEIDTAAEGTDIEDYYDWRIKQILDYQAKLNAYDEIIKGLDNISVYKTRKLGDK